jgi:hypothetical protein
MRGIAHERIALGPVTLFTGYNGTGKTAAVGAVAYALTGRFPGLLAVHPGDLLALANDPRRGFRVRIEADDGTEVERGVDVTFEASTGTDKPEHRFLVGRPGGHPAKSKAAEGLLRTLFGDVAWFVEAFDPERSIWRLSGEKRKEWALNLCAGSSGWSRERLLGEIGKKSDDWNPELGRDAGTCLELNLDNLSERLKDLQRLVREANTVAEGVTVGEGLGIITQRVTSCETDYENARQKLQVLGKSLSDAKAEQTSIDHVRKERARLTQAAADARAELAKLLPPKSPNQTEMLMLVMQLEAAEIRLFSLQVELEDYDAVAESARAARGAAEAELDSLKKLATEHACPTCGAPAPSPLALGAMIGAAEARVAATEQIWAPAEKNRVAAQASYDALEQEIQGFRTARAVHEHAAASFVEREVQFASTWQTVLRNVQSIEDQLGKLPADRADMPSLVLLATDVTTQEDKLGPLKTALAKARAELGVAQERAGQLKSAEDATARIETVKALLAKLRTVRDRMLDDATRPLSDALDQLRDLAPQNGRWTLHRKDKTIDVCLASSRNQYLMEVPVTALSAGERMRGTIALLVARSMVKREPCCLLFIDNFEQIHPDSERVKVLQALARTVRMGFVDNVLVAAACDTIDSQEIDGVAVYERTRDEPSARTGT